MGNTVKSSQQLTTKKKTLQPRLSTDILLEGLLLELIYVYTEIDLHLMWVHACTFGCGLQHQLLQKMWYTCRRCLYSKSCSTIVSLSHTSFSEDIVLQLQSVDLSSSTVHSFIASLYFAHPFFILLFALTYVFASMYYCQCKRSTKTYNLA